VRPELAFADLFADYVGDVRRVVDDPIFAETWHCFGASRNGNAVAPLNLEQWHHRVVHCRQLLPRMVSRSGEDTEKASAIRLRRAVYTMQLLFGADSCRASHFLPLVSEPSVRDIGSKPFKNVDICLPSLHAYSALLALQFGGVLPELKSGAERKFVWQIGAGDGLALCALKQAAPGICAIISDHPENLTLAAAVLKKAFPRDSMLVCRDGEIIQSHAWERFDVILVPLSAVRDFNPPRLDLTFRHLARRPTPAEFVQAVERAYQLRSLFLYDLQTIRPEQAGAAACESWHYRRWYWPHAMPVHSVLPAQVSIAMESLVDGRLEVCGSPRCGEDGSCVTQHVIGWRRVIT
jgi:hypothetical protein